MDECARMIKRKKLQNENVGVEKPSIDPKAICNVLEEDVDVLNLRSTPIVFTACKRKGKKRKITLNSYSKDAECVALVLILP